MAAKKKAAQPKKTSIVQSEDAGTKDRKMAEALMRPSVQAAFTIHAFEKSKVDVLRFAEELTAQIEAVNGGDLKRTEGILITQAHTLNELFNNLARRACNQEYLKQYETYLRLALKAQSQCRATLETLAAIKNPPIMYAKQANFAAGHQQVNNGMPSPAQAGENENQQTKLLEAHNGKWMDTGAAGATSGTDNAMATVGEIDRAKVG